MVQREVGGGRRGPDETQRKGALAPPAASPPWSPRPTAAGEGRGRGGPSQPPSASAISARPALSGFLEPQRPCSPDLETQPAATPDARGRPARVRFPQGGTGTKPLHTQWPPARLCRLLQRASLPSGRRCRCRRRHRAKFRPRPPSAVQGPSVSAPGPRLPASPGPGTMSEKSVEAAAELSAKDLKEKKEKGEEKAGRKERKKEVVEEEENGAEEEEEETAEDGEEEDEGDEEDEEEEEEDDEGPALKRAAEEEDEADPKRQKTENGASA